MTNNEDTVPDTTNVNFSGQSSKTPEQVPTDNSPPMAVLPLNSSAKLDQEPNPFEQSFSTVTAPSERRSHQQQYPYDNNNNKRSESLSSSTSTTTSNSSGNGNSQQQKTVLPPVAAITSPVPPLLRSGVLPKDVANQIAWNSLRAGPLSPSMLQGPQKPPNFEVDNNNNNLPSASSPSYSLLASNTTTVTTLSQQQQQQHQSHNNQRPMSHIYAPDPALSFAMASPAVDEVAPNGYANARSNSMSSSASATSISPTAMTYNSNNNLMSSKQDDRRPSEPSTMKKQHDTNPQFYEDNNNSNNSNSNDDTVKAKKRARSTSNDDKDEDDKKRKSFLERNRIAALKCRQRKKQWLNNLQAKVEYLANDNEQLQVQSNALREEIVNLKTLLLAHKDCPIARQQQQGVFLGLQQEQQHQQQQHNNHNHNHNQNKTSLSIMQPSAETELIPIRYSSATSSTTINNTNNSNNNATNSMQQNMMTFSSHPQAQSMVAGTSSVLRF